MSEQESQATEFDPTAPHNEVYANLRMLRSSIEELDRRMGSAVASVETKKRLEEARAKLSEQYDNLRSNLVEDADEESVEKEEQRRLKLNEVLKQLQAEGPTDELLQGAGLLSQEGTFQYPIDLFSPHSDHLWEAYLKSVIDHMDAVNQAKDSHETDNARLKALDSVRIQKHDEFTHSLVKDFGLDDTPENFDNVRRLAAKMRDSLVPRAGESVLTAEYVRGLIQNQAEGMGQRQAS